MNGLAYLATFVYAANGTGLVLLAARKALDSLTGADLIDAQAAEWAERVERGGGEGEGEREGEGGGATVACVRSPGCRDRVRRRSLLQLALIFCQRLCLHALAPVKSGVPFGQIFRANNDQKTTRLAPRVGLRSTRCRRRRSWTRRSRRCTRR